MRLTKYNIPTGRRTIYLDIDDIVLRTNEAVIDILNKRYNTNKTVQDHVDWGFKSINREVTPDMIQEIVSSEEFWETVKPHDEFFDYLESHDLYDKFDWILVTKRCDENLQQKFFYLSQLPFFQKNNRWASIGYYGLGMDESKADIHMMEGIQIDDNYSNLKDTDAELKILVKNGRDTQYNTCPHATDNLENLYIANQIEEALDILNYIHMIEETGENFMEGLTSEVY